MGRDIQFLAACKGVAKFYQIDSGAPRVAVEVPASEDCPVPFSAVGAVFEDVVKEVQRARERYMKFKNCVPVGRRRRA